MHDPSTGPSIAICNGGNDGACTEAEDVVLHTLRRPGRMAGPGDPDDIPEVKHRDEYPAILFQAPNPDLQNMRAYLQTESSVTLMDSQTGAPIAIVPDSLNLVRTSDIGMVENESEQPLRMAETTRLALGLTDEDPTGMTSDLLQIHAHEPWGHPHSGTGSAIAICNGYNNNHCTEA